MVAPRHPRLALEQMLDAITELERFTAGTSFDAYVGDRKTRRAVERSIEIISEASRSVPAELKARRPAISRPKVAGIGNVLWHDYDVVNNATIWHAATLDLLPLKAAVEAMLREIGADETP